MVMNDRGYGVIATSRMRCVDGRLFSATCRLADSSELAALAGLPFFRVGTRGGARRHGGAGAGDGRARRWSRWTWARSANSRPMRPTTAWASGRSRRPSRPPARRQVRSRPPVAPPPRKRSIWSERWISCCVCTAAVPTFGIGGRSARRCSVAAPPAVKIGPDRIRSAAAVSPAPQGAGRGVERVDHLLRRRIRPDAENGAQLRAPGLELGLQDRVQAAVARAIRDSTARNSKFAAARAASSGFPTMEDGVPKARGRVEHRRAGRVPGADDGVERAARPAAAADSRRAGCRLRRRPRRPRLRRPREARWL